MLRALTCRDCRHKRLPLLCKNTLNKSLHKSSGQCDDAVSQQSDVHVPLTNADACCKSLTWCPAEMLDCLTGILGPSEQACVGACGCQKSQLVKSQALPTCLQICKEFTDHRRPHHTRILTVDGNYVYIVVSVLNPQLPEVHHVRYASRQHWFVL